MLVRSQKCYSTLRYASPLAVAVVAVDGRVKLYIVTLISGVQ